MNMQQIFFNMVARTTLVETEDQLVSRFIGGLRQQIQIVLQQFNPLTVSEAHQRALAMEIQYRSSWGTQNTRSRAVSSQVSDTSSTLPADMNQNRKAGVRPTPATNAATYTLLTIDQHVQVLFGVSLAEKTGIDRPLVLFKIVSGYLIKMQILMRNQSTMTTSLMLIRKK